MCTAVILHVGEKILLPALLCRRIVNRVQMLRSSACPQPVMLLVYQYITNTAQCCCLPPRYRQQHIFTSTITTATHLHYYNNNNNRPHFFLSAPAPTAHSCRPHCLATQTSPPRVANGSVATHYSPHFSSEAADAPIAASLGKI